jgi:hypothetical protein
VREVRRSWSEEIVSCLQTHLWPVHMCTSPNRTSTSVAFAAALVMANAHALLPSTALAGCAGSVCRHTPSAPATTESAKAVAPDVIDVFTHAPAGAKP